MEFLLHVEGTVYESRDKLKLVTLIFVLWVRCVSKFRL